MKLKQLTYTQMRVGIVDSDPEREVITLYSDSHSSTFTLTITNRTLFGLLRAGEYFNVELSPVKKD